MPLLTYDFETYIYLCSLILTINLIYTIKFKLNKKLPNFMVSLNSLFLVTISNISLFNDGIYIDELNLSGSAISFCANLLNNIFGLIIILIFLSLRFSDKKALKL